MYQSKNPYKYGTGRRKSSVARVHLFENGTGSITINGRSIDEYFGLETLKMVVRQPLNATNTLGKVDIVATVEGGGVSGQDRQGGQGAQAAKPRQKRRFVGGVRHGAPATTVRAGWKGGPGMG